MLYDMQDIIFSRIYVYPSSLTIPVINVIQLT